MNLTRGWPLYYGVDLLWVTLMHFRALLATGRLLRAPECYADWALASGMGRRLASRLRYNPHPHPLGVGRLAPKPCVRGHYSVRVTGTRPCLAG